MQKWYTSGLHFTKNAHLAIGKIYELDGWFTADVLKMPIANCESKWDGGASQLRSRQKADGSVARLGLLHAAVPPFGAGFGKVARRWRVDRWSSIQNNFGFGVCGVVRNSSGDEWMYQSWRRIDIGEFWLGSKEKSPPFFKGLSHSKPHLGSSSHGVSTSRIFQNPYFHHHNHHNHHNHNNLGCPQLPLGLCMGYGEG